MATEPGELNAIVTRDTPAAQRRAWLRPFLILFSSFLVMIGVAAYSIVFDLQNYWSTALLQETTRNLTQKTRMLASRIEADHITPVTDIAAQEGQHAGARATVIDANGRVVADSEVPAATLDNQGQLPEFVAALRGETGIQTRQHNQVPVLYVAVPVGGGAARLAYPLADYEILRERTRELLIVGCAVAVISGFAISLLAARMLTRTS